MKALSTSRGLLRDCETDGSFYSTSNDAASPGRGAVVVDAELAVTLARGQGTLLVSPLAAAL